MSYEEIAKLPGASPNLVPPNSNLKNRAGSRTVELGQLGQINQSEESSEFELPP